MMENREESAHEHMFHKVKAELVAIVIGQGSLKCRMIRSHTKNRFCSHCVV